jgi:hypothetical protein
MSRSSAFKTAGKRRARGEQWAGKKRINIGSLLSPGIIVIRRMMLQPLKAEAERRAEGRRAANSERVAPVAAESMAR